MKETISEHRMRGRQDYFDGKPLASPPEKVYYYGRAEKTRRANEENAEIYLEYLAGYQDGPGLRID